jgi:hypothetical protein
LDTNVHGRHGCPHRLRGFAGLEDNMDLSRIARPTARDYARIEKYKAAKVVIEKAIAGVA